MFHGEKTFGIFCCIHNEGVKHNLPCSQTQANQGSDLNVISMELVTKLGLQLQSLYFIRFRGLIMRTANHEYTRLYYWICLNMGVKDIWRQIR